MSNKKGENETADVTANMAQTILDAMDAIINITEIHTDFLDKKIAYNEAIKKILENKRVIMTAIDAVENVALKLANPLLNTYLLMKYLDLKDLLKEADDTLKSMRSTLQRQAYDYQPGEEIERD